MANKMTVLERLKSIQQSGSPVCPRCGRESIKEPLHTNALSRVADIYVCDDCGMDEALRAFAGLPLPIEEWVEANRNFCVECCEYDAPKNAKSGYCVQAKIRLGTGVVSANGYCEKFLRGKFQDRLKLRAERDAAE